MKKILNSPDTFVRDTMEGIFAAHGDAVAPLNGDPTVIMNTRPVQEGKVSIVTAGGSGHLPLFLGYVGDGMLDGCAVGDVFASPSSEKMAAMIRAADHGAGVLALYGNYNGDRFNFEMACEDVDFDDIETRQVMARDDVASSPKENAAKRRGVAGLVLAYKIAGAAAAAMMSLDEVTTVTEKALENTRSMGVALSPCIVPKVGEPSFTIADDEIEIGMGIHGEAGIEIRSMMSADEIAELLLTKILEDMPVADGDQVTVMINGLGATPLEEQFIVYRSVHRLLQERGISVLHPHIGEFATSMEMAGLSLTVLSLDDQLKELLEAPASTPFYTNSNK